MTGNSSELAASRLFRAGRPVRYKKGELIAQSGEQPDGAHAILHGHVRVYTISNEGNERILITLGPGDIFPIEWIFTGYLQDLYFEAMDSVATLKMTKHQLQSQIEQSVGELQWLLRYLGWTAQQRTERIRNLEYATATERLAHYLVLSAQQFGKQEKQGILLDAPLTHQHIANSINLARETVSRELESLRRQDIIAYQGRKIVITASSHLTELLG